MAAQRVKLKICGIKSWADARRACEAGADFLGFNFYAASPRYIDPSRARQIVKRLPGHVSAVGVFVNESEENLVKTVRMVGLKCVQLHGDETPEFIGRLRRVLRPVKVIRAIRVAKTPRVGEMRRFAGASAILLDGFDRRRRGGTGKAFDWSMIPRGKMRTRIFLAGGITPENVADAIRVARPYAIDVCSGVESAPGKKDPVKIRALMRAIKVSRPATAKG